MKATKKIVGAACALVAAVALSAGSTFAWFTSNNKVSVDQIEANVVTGTGDLRIALVSKAEDTGKYSIGAYSYKLTAPSFTGKLDAVTTSDSLSFVKGTKNDATGEVELGDGKTTAAVAGTDYYQFTFALLSSTNMKVYLDYGTAVGGEAVASESGADVVMPWASLADTVYGKATTLGTPLETEAKNATRVSFVPWAAPGAGGELTAPTAAVSDTKYWAPYDSSDESTGGGYYKGNLAKDYMKGSATGTYPTTGADAYYLPDSAKEVEILAAAGTVASEAHFVELTKNVPAIITVNLWIEGEDGDCFNTIFDDKVTLDLKFFGVDVTTSVGG